MSQSRMSKFFFPLVDGFPHNLIGYLKRQYFERTKMSEVKVGKYSMFR